MKYQIGDKIIVLHSDEEGRVVEMINDQMVMIEVRGVRFPAYMDQIDFPYFKMFTQKKTFEKKKLHIDQVKKEKPTMRSKSGEGVLLHLVPVFVTDVFDDEIVDRLKVYLVNHNEEAYSFSYTLLLGGNETFQHQGILDKQTDFYLHDVDFEDVSDGPAFSFEFSLQIPDKKKAPYYEREIKLRGKQLFKKIEELKEKNQPAFSYELFLVYPDKTMEEKVDLSNLGNAGFRIIDASRFKETLPPPRTAVDLHIEKITDQWKSLPNNEILMIQLNEFEKYYNLAVAHHQPSLIVVHGIGEGILREEIHQILKSRKEVKSFVNQYHHLYGYGATEIFFTY